MDEVLAELALHCAHHRHLLRLDHRLEEHGDGEVDVVVAHVVAQVHARRRLRHPNERLDVSDGDAHAARVGLAAQLGVHLRDLPLVHVVELRLGVLARVRDVLAEQRLVDHVGVLVAPRRLAREQHLSRPRVVPLVRVHHKLREALILDGVDLVLDDADAVEAREDGLGELHILGEGDGGVVAALDGVGGGDHRAPRAQRRGDPSLGDRDGLLLHGLVDRGAVGVVHLVELVDQADALVGEHERAAFERPLARHRLLVHRRRQTDGRGSLAGGEDGARRRLLDVLEELRLGRARITEEEHVDVATDAVLAVHILRVAAEH